MAPQSPTDDKRVTLGAVPDYDPTHPWHRAAMATLLDLLSDPANPNPAAMAHGARENWTSAVLTYGHPHAELFARLANAGLRVVIPAADIAYAEGRTEGGRL